MGSLKMTSSTRPHPDKEAVLAVFRQKLYDRLPKETKGNVGQAIVDCLCEVRCDKSETEPDLVLRFVFADPDDNRWHISKKMSHRLSPTKAHNAEAYLLDRATYLSADEVAQLAMVLT